MAVRICETAAAITVKLVFYFACLFQAGFFCFLGEIVDVFHIQMQGYGGTSQSQRADHFHFWKLIANHQLRHTDA
ncbi:hypothetical protein D3C86_2223840 [compost metagenome]